MELLSYLVPVMALAVTFLVLVAVHEYGHYIVARYYGVHVIRFSIGFGPVLWSKRNSQDTEFAVAAIPLGGYVKMLDEREGPVPTERLAEAFTSKSPWQRIAVALAGPIANLLLAWVAFWLVQMLGTTQDLAHVVAVQENSPAAAAGLQPGMEILAVDGVQVGKAQDLYLQLLQRLGESGQLTFSVRTTATGVPPEDVVLVLDAWLQGETDPNPLEDLGFKLGIPAVLGAVVASGAAESAGLRAQDRILAVDGEEVRDWQHWVSLLQAAPGRELSLLVQRDGRELDLYLTPATRVQADGRSYGFAGVGVHRRTVSSGPLRAIPEALGMTWQYTVLTLDFLVKMVGGQISPTNLGGPGTIAKVAGESIAIGLQPYLFFLAIISIGLAVINLLPIPVLDGGHVVFYLIEAAMGKPLPLHWQARAVQVGMVLVLSVMVYAIYNDIMRF